MTRIEQLENQIKQLNSDELAAFRKWFREFDAEEWDRQIERDVEAGRLDRLADKAIEDYQAGRIKEL